MDIGTLTGYIILEDNLSPALSLASKNLKSFGQDARAAGVSLSAAITLPLTAVAGLATKAAIDFQSSFAGVVKTVDATAPELEVLKESFRGLAMEMPTSVNELNRIAEAGGQLGVAKEDLLVFTKTMAMMGTATNLSSDAAATSLAQIANIISNEAGPQYDKLGATVVELGNKSAATEQDIVEFGLRLAGAGKVAGLSEADILSVGTALASVGISSEAGGTAFSKVMIDMAKAVEEGGTKLNNFASVAMNALDSPIHSAEEFQKAFKDDAAGALAEFVKGLGQVEAKGGSLFTTLENLGITEQRMRDALLRTSGAGDMLNKTLATGRQAWKDASDATGDHNALIKESKTRFETMASQLAVMRNKLNDAAITLGTALMPVLLDVLKVVEPLVVWLGKAAKWFAELPGPIKLTAVAFLAIVAAIGPILVGLGMMATGFATIIPLFAAGTVGAGLLTGALGLLQVAFGPIGLSIAALVYGVNQLIGAVANLNKGWAEGKTTWEILSKRDDDNFIRQSYLSMKDWMTGAKDMEKAGVAAGEGIKTSLQGLLDKQKQFNGQPMNFQVNTQGDINKLEQDLKVLSEQGLLTTETIKTVGAALEGTGLKFTGVTPQVMAVANAYKAMNAPTEAAAAATTAGMSATDKAAFKAKELQRNLEALRKDALTPLTEAQKAYIIEAKAAGDEESKIAGVVGVSERAITTYLNANKESKQALEEHTKAVKEQYDAMIGSTKEIRATQEAFAKLTPEQLTNTEIQKNLIPVLMKLAADTGVLTEKQRGALLAALDSRDAFKEHEVQLLSSQGVTKEMIDAQLALGRTTAEIGIKYKVSAGAVEAYIKKQDDLVESTKRIEDRWRDYGATVAKTDQEVLDSQLSGIDAWYQTEYKAIADNARNNINAWGELEGLNALFWAKRTKTIEDASKQAADRVKAERDALNDFQMKNSLSTTDYEVSRIWYVVEQQIAADKASGKTNEEVNRLRIQLAKERTDALYIDNAAMTANSNENLQEIANKAATTYEAMAAEPWNYSEEAIAAQRQIFIQAQNTASGIEDTYGQALGNLSAMFQKLGQVTGGSFGSIMGSVGKAVVGLEEAHRQSQLIGKDGLAIGGSFGSLSTVFNSNAKGMDRMAAGAAAAASIAQGAVEVWSATSSKKTAMGNAGAGAMAGMQAGAAFGPYGMAIGAAAGFVTGLIRGKPEWAKVQEDMAKDFGAEVSDELSKAIAETAKEEFKGDRGVAAVSHLSDIIGEAGLDSENLGQMTSRLHDVFSYIETGQMSLAQGTKVIEENWASFAEAGTSSFGLLTADLVDIVKLTKEAGIESKALIEYLGQQGATAAGAFGSAITIGSDALASYDELNLKQLALRAEMATLDLSDEDDAEKWAELNAEVQAIQPELEKYGELWNAVGIQSKESVDALAAGVAASFQAMIDGGASYAEAIAAIEPAISGLQEQMVATGIEGGEVFTQLQSQVNLYADEVAGPALTAVDSLTQGMVALDNMGAMNQDTFAALSGQVTHTFDSLVAGGQSSDVVMLGMRDSIQRMWEEQQQFGYTTDEATQAIIDQAVEQGIVGQKHKSVADQMLDATNRMVTALEGVATAMGVGIPAAADHAARVTRGAADTMVDDWDRVHRAATEVAEGRSPNGIKQISVRTAEAQQLVEVAATQMVAAFGWIFTAATSVGDAIWDTFESVHTQIAEFEGAAAATQLLTDAQKVFIDRASAAGVSLSDIAQLLGTSTDAIKLYVDAQKAASAAIAATVAENQAHEDVLKGINQAIADYQGASAEAAKLTQTQRDFIDDALEAGVSVDTLASALGTTVNAINAYIDAQEAAADASQAAADAAIEAAEAVATEEKKLTDINQAISEHKNAASDAAKLTADQRSFINDAVAAGVTVSALADVLDTTTSAIQYFIDSQKLATQGTVDPLTLEQGYERYRREYGSSLASPTEYYATGGEVHPFEPKGTDTVPAMLSPGERVLTVEQNNEYEQTTEGPSNQDVVDALNGLRIDMTSKVPRALARSLHSALVGLRTAS